MSWLLFMDESGHDHHNTPMEVRGGIAIHDSQVWNFIKEWNESRDNIFGTEFTQLKGEIKGSKLLETKKLKWAMQMPTMHYEERIKAINRFLTNGLQKKSPQKRDFTAYGQASLLMAEKTFSLLHKYDAVIFASAIPKGVKAPPNYTKTHLLRKDHIFLQERFFYFLNEKEEYGLMVMDQTEKQNDKRFLRKLHDYYIKTQLGQERTKWIIPTPFFIDSEMSPGIQAADLCIYCINWGFRRPEWNFTGPKRDDIHDKFAGLLGAMQFTGNGQKDGNNFRTYSIVYVPDPYSSRDNTT